MVQRTCLAAKSSMKISAALIGPGAQFDAVSVTNGLSRHDLLLPAPSFRAQGGSFAFPPNRLSQSRNTNGGTHRHESILYSQRLNKLWAFPAGSLLSSHMESVH